jgi:3-oxoacyl-[acyl-carrier protein] reductase
MNTSLTQLCPSPGSRMVVVGGCGGIGRAVVGAAVAAGLSVVVLDLAASIQKHHVPEGEQALALDASSESSVAAAFAKLDGLDCLVNLCGFSVERKPIGELSVDQWDEGIAGNLRAAFLVSQHALRKMTSGTIVHVSSGLGVYAGMNLGPYPAAKGGINALTKTIAREYAPRIRANAVAPSYVETAFGKGGTGRSAEADAETLDKTAYVRGIPLARLGAPEDIVGPIMFLAGPASRYITGQVLHVNGGSFMP